MKRIHILVVCILLSACASPTIPVKKGVQIQTLRIYFAADPTAFPILTSRFDSELDKFIVAFNQEKNHSFKLERTDNPNDSSTLIVQLKASRLVTRNEQVMGVMVSLIGLSMPVLMASAGSPLYIFFYYFPNAKSQTDLSVSPDLREDNQTVFPTLYTSPGFLMSPDKQIQKHGQLFPKFMRSIIKGIEQSGKKKR